MAGTTGLERAAPKNSIKNKLRLRESPAEASPRALSTCLIYKSRLGFAARTFTSWRHGWPGCSPRIRTCSVQVSDAYGHRSKSVRKSNFTANRPPVVQENLERAPHRNPAPDRKA